jgi:hypothetical protein
VGLESHAAAEFAAAMVDCREDYFYFLPFLTVFLTAFFAFFAGMHPPLVRIWPARGRASANALRNGQLSLLKVDANGIKVTRERWVAQSIAKSIRISSEMSIVFARKDNNLDDKAFAIGPRLRQKSEVSGTIESAVDAHRVLRPDGGECALPECYARAGCEPHVQNVWVWCVDAYTVAVAEVAGRDFHAISRHHLV